MSIALVTSCSNVQRPIATNYSENNSDCRISYLFKYDGCKVYRFYDNGNRIYFTNCNGNVTAIKNDSTETRIETIIRIR
ncbi:MAG TPA: DUF4884 domain-containing protein [Dysgonomonas sp.]|nr:DUF4884 domain-containing protein [Dysgonomonas sp.]